MAAPIERPHEQALHDDAERRHRDRRQQQRPPEAAREAEDGKPKERAQHEERAMRQADHVHEAENQRQAGRHQEQQHAIDQPVQELGDEEFHSPLSVPIVPIVAPASERVTHFGPHPIWPCFKTPGPAARLLRTRSE
jgi:hypothetical protein